MSGKGTGMICGVVVVVKHSTLRWYGELGTPCLSFIKGERLVCALDAILF